MCTILMTARKRVYRGWSERTLPPATRSTLLATCCLHRDRVARGDVKNAGRSSLSYSTEGCLDELKRLAKRRSAGSGQQRFSQTISRVFLERTEAAHPASAKRFDQRRCDSHLTASTKRSYAPRQIDFHIRTKNKIVIRNSQLLLSLILSLLLIGVGLIGFGKRTGLATM
jgi:hypothetical protein